MENEATTKRNEGTETMTVAQTILSQLGGKKFVAMTGAKNLMADTDTLNMRLPGKMTMKGINHLAITLEADDTYTMKFGKIYKLQYTVVETVEGVYCDMLQDVFEASTGLLVTLGQRA